MQTVVADMSAQAEDLAVLCKLVVYGQTDGLIDRYSDSGAGWQAIKGLSDRHLARHTHGQTDGAHLCTAGAAALICICPQDNKEQHACMHYICCKLVPLVVALVLQALFGTCFCSHSRLHTTIQSWCYHVHLLHLAVTWTGAEDRLSFSFASVHP